MFKKTIIPLLSLLIIVSSAMFSGVTANAVNNVVRVTTTQELKTALANAQPGDEIVVAEGEYIYSGSSSKGYTFLGTADGTQQNPIIIRSENPEKPAVLQCSDTGSKNVFTVTGDWWVIRNLKMTRAQKGIVLDNSNHTKIIGCEVYNFGQEAIHIRDNSS